MKKTLTLAVIRDAQLIKLGIMNYVNSPSLW